jgi:hypothetical protein
MSMNLAELGLVLCREFDQRELELKTLHSEIWTKVKNGREELSKLSDVERASQMKNQKKIIEDTCSLLDKYRAERKTMEQGLKADRVSQIDEIKTWVNERGEELKGWSEAGGYMLRKRTGR